MCVPVVTLSPLDIPLINCEINLILTWFENCVITNKATRDTDPNADPAKPAINVPSNARFKMKDTKCVFRLLLFHHKMMKIS